MATLFTNIRSDHPVQPLQTLLMLRRVIAASILPDGNMISDDTKKRLLAKLDKAITICRNNGSVPFDKALVFTEVFIAIGEAGFFGPESQF